MAKVHGKDTYWSLDSDDLSQFSNNLQSERTADSHDTTTFGKTAHVFSGGLKNGTATVTGFYDSSNTAGPRAIIEPLLGTVVPMIYRPEGTGAGKPEDQVDVLVIKYTETSPVADMKTFSVDLQYSDDVETITQPV